MSDNKDFFKKQTDSSRVKAAIISEYFPQYCKIISRRHVPQRFGYFDMFAGPGIYNDGSLSTPLLIAKNCYEDQFLRERVWMVFNDMTFGDKLKENFEKYYQSGTFANEPFFANRTFGEWPKIDTFLTRNTMQGFYNECPTVLFIDPWGYKHINTRVLTQFLTQWGNEVFIFINTKRLNAAFENQKFQDDLKIVFPLTYNEVKDNKKMIQGDVEVRHKYMINHLAEEYWVAWFFIQLSNSVKKPSLRRATTSSISLRGLRALNSLSKYIVNTPTLRGCFPEWKMWKHTPSTLKAY